MTASSEPAAAALALPAEGPAAPAPAADPVSSEFWAHIADGRLAVQRCDGCELYHHPPVALCWRCQSASLRYRAVSGRGTVAAYSETRSGARHPHFAAAVPYLVGLVELEEQEGLLMYSNFPGATLAELRTGAPVRVTFEARAAGVTVPQFVLAGRPAPEAG